MEKVINEVTKIVFAVSTVKTTDNPIYVIMDLQKSDFQLLDDAFLNIFLLKLV